MAKLYFRYGTMKSSRTTNALMVDYNYHERNKQVLLVKPETDFRDGDRTIRSRMELEGEGILLEELVEMADEKIRKYDCIVVDEAQFATKVQVEFFAHIMDNLGVPVICYGLRTDFHREFFKGNPWLMAWTDKTKGVKTMCWCRKTTTYNTRIGENGKMIQSGEQIIMDGNDRYTALCRKHH